MTNEEVDKIIFVTHGLRGFPYHFWTADNEVYQKSHCPKRRTLPSHLKKQVRNGQHQMCKGFMIYGKFKSRTFLGKLKYPIAIQVINIEEEADCPF